MKPLLVAIALMFAIPATAQDTRLTVTVTGAEPNRGQMLISVFDSPKTYLRVPDHSAVVQVGHNGLAIATLEIPVGEYAVSAVYDRNKDGRMNTNALGLPTEAFAFSNNARALFGPPKYKIAKIELLPGMRSIRIDLDRIKER
ncbi:MAG: DUF2141 domain-containing protein [Rhodobacteraceae bacterium]|nr:DUF2141 domain-containing protein [Paracoccaceae bacterium]